MDLVKKAFYALYPGKALDKSVSLRYSKRFKPYNANVRITPNSLDFSLSKEWKSISPSIQVGLIQSLLKKIYKTDNHSPNLDLYNIFIKRLEKIVPKTRYDPILAQSFKRNNEIYFFNSLDLPNLRWGRESTTKLGSYEYQSDTITISSIFRDSDRTLLDYVMYHEMLHKKLKYRQSKSRSYHHTKEFKKREKEFPGSEKIEKDIARLCRSYPKKQKKQPFFQGLYNPFKKIS